MSIQNLTRAVTCCLAVAMVAMITAPMDAAAQDNPVVVIETSLGNITAELDRANAPLSVENFLEYADSGHYSGTVFHRVIKGFMIQGGGFTADMQQKPTRAPVKNEARNGLSNDRGTLAMARTPSSTAEPLSSSSTRKTTRRSTTADSLRPSTGTPCSAA